MYTNYYGLTRKPFQLLPDTDFFYDSQVHKRALAYLQYGLEQGSGFVVITGVPGTGKTMLVRELFHNLSSDIHPILIQTSNLDTDEILTWIATALAINDVSVNKAVLMLSIEESLRSIRSEGKRVLLVIDEAQNLPVSSLEEIRMLLNLDSDGHSLFQVFLIGQVELKNTLQSESLLQVRQRITATHHLKPLDLSETKSYIIHRLETAGWKKNPEFTEEAFHSIHEFSDGIPRVINSICDRILLYGFLEELSSIDLAAVKSVVEEQSAEDIVENNVSHSTSESKFVNVNVNGSNHLEMTTTVSVSARLESIENQLSEIKIELTKEKELLRKAILIQLDMSDYYKR